ncbi:MAG: cupin domain-containing protein [Actinomycetota bacterium]|nr:cupin domain-containing protein [Actinomycetota bacterium]
MASRKADFEEPAEAEVAPPPTELEEIVSSIGPKLRELRAQRGLSLQQMADLSDVSAAAIHKIERNGMVPTITTLLKIAGAFNRPISYFVEEPDPDNRPVSFTPAKGRRNLFTSHQGIDLAAISGPYGRFFLAGAVAEVEPGASSGRKPMEHPGEELVLLLDGALEIDVDGSTFKLAEGDSLHFRTDRPHRWRNPGTESCHAVWLALRPL